MQLDAFRRGGVPVLSRIREKPSFERHSDSKFTAGRPSPPDSWHSFPIQILPLKVVPAVKTTAFEAIEPLCSVTTPESL